MKTFIHSVVPLRTIPDSRPKWQSVYLFSDQNGAKTLPDGAAHTYIAYIREYPPPRFPSLYCHEPVIGIDVLCEQSILLSS